jgi:hypothetical protein
MQAADGRTASTNGGPGAHGATDRSIRALLGQVREDSLTKQRDKTRDEGFAIGMRGRRTAPARAS